jgi:hypothetical protein
MLITPSPITHAETVLASFNFNRTIWRLLLAPAKGQID